MEASDGPGGGLVVLEVVLQLFLLQLRDLVEKLWDNYKGLPMLELWTASTRSR